MHLLLLIIPLAAVISATVLYQKTGKRDFLKLDLVQFVYAFVLAPLTLVWMKSFIYYLLRQEIDLRFSMDEIFLVDSVFSVLAMFVYAFIVIHSITKSFELKRYSDPLYDVFTHSESLHLWISHTALYLGTMALFTTVSLFNAYFPLEIMMPKVIYYLFLGFSFMAGVSGFAGIWMSNFTDKVTFLRLMKLGIALAFILHVVVYFLVDPSFNPNQIVYWMMFMSFLAMTICAYIFERSERTAGFFERLHHKVGWKKGDFKLSKSKFRF